MKSFMNGLGQWSTEFLQQKHFVTEHMASFYHFKKHEMISLEDLCSLKLKTYEGLKKKIESLTQKK